MTNLFFFSEQVQVFDRKLCYNDVGTFFCIPDKTSHPIGWRPIS